MSAFKKLNTKIYQKSGPDVTPDFIYWKKLGNPVLVKEFGPIDYVDFSPVDPHYFVVTCSVRVQVYNPITKLVVKNLSRFSQSAYGANFRYDGSLICAGGEEALIKLFDVSKKHLLRTFRGHAAPVHRTAFMRGKPHIASFSDDKSVKIWDIPTETAVSTYTGHSDYIRAGTVNPSVHDILLSGGYDGIVKMYDSRTDKEIFSVNHGCQVESLLFLPSGGVFLSAGGTDIKIWDTIAGGKLVGSISQHHKTITCLKLASNEKRLLSGSLDRHVKIYDISTFKVVHTLDYSNGVLSLGVSKNDDTVVAGLVDGVIAINRREESPTEEKTQKSLVSYQYNTSAMPATVDAFVPQESHEKEAKYDHHLRKFEYSKALACVLLPYVANKHPENTVMLIQELIRRRAFQKALIASDNKIIIKLLRFFIRNITDQRFSRILIDAVDICLDTISKGSNSLPPAIGKLLVDLSQLLTQEDELINDLTSLQGIMQTLLACQVVDKTSNENDSIKISSAG